MIRYLKLYREILKYNFSQNLQFRSDFWISFFSRIAWFVMLIFFFSVIYTNTATINGWNYYQMLLLFSVFHFIETILFTLFVRNFSEMNSYISEGDLDFILLKPVDPQFLVSLRYFSVTSAFNLVAPVILFVIAFRHLGLHLALSQIALFSLALMASLVILYSLWFLTVITLFWLTKIFEIQEIFLSLFGFMRYPATIYQGPVRYFFSFLFPIILTVTVPAQIFLDTLETPYQILWLPLAAILTFAVSRGVWRLGLRRYSSASS